MKVLLINPPITRHKTDPLAGEGGNIPLGLISLAAFIRENGYKVNVLDAMALGVGNVEKVRKNYIRTGLDAKTIKIEINKFNPDIVGISSMFTCYAQDALEMADLVKGIDKNIPVIMGGVHASACPDLVLQDKNVDIVVYGEGELTFLEIIKKIERKEDIKKIKGTIIRSDKKLIKNEKREFIEDLDSLPYPARDLIPMDVYINAAKMTYAMRQPVLDISTSRGCLGNCSYCGIHAVWEHSWRGKSAKLVVDEIEHLMRQYQAREFRFLDDSVSTDRKRMSEICDELIKRKLNITWTTPNGIAIWTLDKDLLKKMRESGCYRLTFGIESGNEETQKYIGKIIKFEKAQEIVKYCNYLGMWTLATFIIGFPSETKKQIMETLRYAVNLDIDIAFFNVLMPFPNTRVYDSFFQLGLLPAKQTLEFYAAFSGRGGGCNTEFLKKEELVDLRNEAHKMFFKSRLIKFINPVRILRKIKSLEKLKYFIRLMANSFFYSSGSFETKSNPSKGEQSE